MEDETSTPTQKTNNSNEDHSDCDHVDAIPSTNYLFIEERINSFKTIDPECSVQKKIFLQNEAKRLALTGFYYTGSKDKVQCIFCSACLYNWNVDDDPIIEHAYWFPNCQHPRRLLGEIMMSKLQTIKEFTNVDDSTKRRMVYDLLVSTNANIKCAQCLKRYIGVCFLPCRHVKFCTTCGLQMLECPICKREVEMFIQVNL